MNGCRSTIGAILMKFEITPPNACGNTTMNAQTWHWAASPPNSGWPWPHSSTSQSGGLWGDYPLFPKAILAQIFNRQTATAYIDKAWLH